jgi:hypothetical protein
VHFPAPGNFKLICLVHQDMTGVVHVLNVSQALPNDQNAGQRMSERCCRRMPLAWRVEETPGMRMKCVAAK